MSRVPITIEGEIALKDELSKLKFIERPKISEAIAEARAHGDLKENAEYHAAKELQGLMEAKINEIENALSNAQVINVKDIPETGRVVFGSTVKLYDVNNDKEIVYKIVGNLESDPEMEISQLKHQLQKVWLASLLMMRWKSLLRLEK